MCPDPQVLSIYMDGELPSPWKEKLEAHLSQCPGCTKKLDNFKRLLKPDNNLVDEARSRVWEKLQSRHQFCRNRQHIHSSPGFINKKLSVPLPVAAAAAVIIALLTAFWVRDGQSRRQPDHNNFSNRANLIIAAEEEIPIFPAPSLDLNGVLQFLGSDGTDILIMRLPESRSFSRSGEPAIIRAADYSRRRP